MEIRTIYITEFDFERLEALINAASPNSPNKDHLRELQEELDQAEIVPSMEIPQDVITMNSKVRLKDLDSKEEIVYSLVFPHDADIDQNKISILAPIGVALIGYRLGDIIEWKVPAGKRRLKVDAILYQPEASGNYNL